MADTAQTKMAALDEAEIEERLGTGAFREREYFRYWLYRIGPELTLSESDSVAWPIARYARSIGEGDVVFFWTTGTQPGIHAWGRVLTPPDESIERGEADLSYATVRIERKLSEPITPEKIRTKLGLMSFNVMWGVEGTDLRVSALEADQLLGLLEPEDKILPTIPRGESAEDGPVISAQTIHDYRYDPRSMKVMNACLELAQGETRAVTSFLLAVTTLRMGMVDPEFAGQLGKIIPAFSDPYARDELLKSASPWLPSNMLELLHNDEFLLSQPFEQLWPIEDTLVQLGLLDQLAFAKTLAVTGTLNETIQLHHLLAAVCCFEENEQMMAELSREPQDELRERILAVVADRYPDENQSMWASCIRPGRLRFNQASCSSDCESGTDYLNVGDESYAFASLVSSANVDPPLAVGLFGDWGSGKSFFMDKIQKNVDRIAAASRPHAGDEGSAYCSHIVQVRFNAWHYVETNIWASLVSTVFQELDDEFGSSEGVIAGLRAQAAPESERHQAQRNFQAERSKASEKLREAEAYADGKEVDLEGLGGKAAREIAQLEQICEDLPYSSAKDVLTNAKLAAQTLGKGEEVWEVIKGLVASPAGRVRLAMIGVFGVAGGLAWAMGYSDLLGKGLSVITKAATVIVPLLSMIRQYVKGSSGIRIARETAPALREKSKEHWREIRDLRRKGLATYDKLLPHIRSRMENNEYREHLGMAKVIQQDLELLSDYMKSINPARMAADEKYVDRIILYIDDLDRCPPEVVVDVIQAIRMLLAYELFVVVVGVDVRWMAGALRKKYPDLLQQDDLCELGTPTRTKQNQATAQDYLEKVFQIPFWVRPMRSDMTGPLIRGVLKNQVLAEDMAPGGGTADVREVRVVDRAGIYRDEDVVETPDKPIPFVDLQPESLLLRQTEVDFMARLGILAGRTPRAVKRFTNVYRLLKSAYEEMRESSFAATEDGGYREVLFLLAVVSAWPEASHRFFRLVELNQSANLQELCKGLSAEQQGQGYWSEFLLALWGFCLDEPKDLECSSLNQWLQYVTRFGFRKWHGDLAAEIRDKEAEALAKG